MKLTIGFNRSLGHLCGEITHRLACKCYLKFHKFMSHDSIFIKRFMVNIEQLAPKNYFNWSLLQTVMQLSRNTIILFLSHTLLTQKVKLYSIIIKFVLLPTNLSFTYTIIVARQQKLRYDNIFSHVCLSFCRGEGIHVIITHDAIGHLTIQRSPRPQPAPPPVIQLSYLANLESEVKPQFPW